MKRRVKEVVSLILAVSMVFAMNTLSFAEEVGEKEDPFLVDEEDYSSEVNDFMTDEEIKVDALNSTASTNGASQNYVLLSENAERVKEELSEIKTATISGSNVTYAVVYKKAVAYDGSKYAWSKKAGSKKKGIDIKVYRLSGSASSNQIESLSDNTLLSSAGWKEETVKNITLKCSKGATVDITGKGIVPVNKATYISAIKLENKDNNKELNGLLKDTIKAMKKNKTDKVSSNGIIVGKSGTSKSDRVDLMIAVYPAYAGNDTASATEAKSLGLATVTYGSDAVKTKKGTAEIKSVKGTLGSKKITLKPTKKEDSPKGIAKATGSAAADAGTGKYLAETDGNFFGFIEYSVSK